MFERRFTKLSVSSELFRNQTILNRERISVVGVKIGKKGEHYTKTDLNHSRIMHNIQQLNKTVGKFHIPMHTCIVRYQCMYGYNVSTKIHVLILLDTLAAQMFVARYFA